LFKSKIKGGGGPFFDIPPLKLRALFLNLPLEVRGIKGVISIILITPLSPLILRRARPKNGEVKILRWQKRPVLWILVI
jgi:hypothetical protein